MKRSLAILALALAGAGAGSALYARVAAQGQPAHQGVAGQPADVLPELLVEVRGLRAAMEAMASAGPRVQLALGRVQLQEQRVNNLLRRVEELRANTAHSQEVYNHMQQEIQGMEDGIRDPQPGGPPVADLQRAQRGMRVEAARAAAEVQRMGAEEAAAASELATEQARWTDLNQRMEALETSLIRR